MKNNATERRSRRSYSAEERETILADAETLGVGEAARRHGVPQSTVSNWRNRPVAAKAATTAAEPTAEPTSPPRSVAPPAKRVAKRYTPTQKAEIVEYAAKHSVLKASEHFGVSRFAIYDWQKRVAKAARGQGPSPTSGPSQREIEEQRDGEILGEWHKHRGLGPSQVKRLARMKPLSPPRAVHRKRRSAKYTVRRCWIATPRLDRTAHEPCAVQPEWVVRVASAVNLRLASARVYPRGPRMHRVQATSLWSWSGGPRAGAGRMGVARRLAFSPSGTIRYTRHPVLRSGG